MAKKGKEKAKEKGKAKAKTKAEGKARKEAAPKAAKVKQPRPRKGWVPKGFSTVTANLVFKDSIQAIELYREAFGAKELQRMMSPDGKSVWHAELRIGDSIVYLNDESEMTYAKAPTAEGRPSSSIQIYVKDCDRWFERAVAAGCKALVPVSDMFWGDRMGVVVDPFNQQWSIASRVADLSPKQMRKAGEAFVKSLAQAAEAPAPSSSPASSPSSDS